MLKKVMNVAVDVVMAIILAVVLFGLGRVYTLAEMNRKEMNTRYEQLCADPFVSTVEYQSYGIGNYEIRYENFIQSAMGTGQTVENYEWELEDLIPEFLQ